MKKQLKKYSCHDLADDISNEDILVNALESDMKNDAERNYLAEYKQVFEQYLTKQEEWLSIDLYEEGMTCDKFDALVELQERLDEEMDELDNRLCELEKQLKNVIDREKAKACQTHITEEPTFQKKKISIKEKLVNALGMVGVIIFYLMRLIIYVLPFVMIGGSFFVTLLLVSINTFVPLSSAVFWIWGLVCALKGVQDFWTILYYICFVVIWLPFYIEIIASFFSNKNK